MVDDGGMAVVDDGGMSATHAELLAAVERSPQAAAAHDRDGWVGLFAPGGCIEDPVGSRPHRGRMAVERFYDTFIGPRDITFHRGADVVAGATVIRDLELEVRMGPSLVMMIPAYLRYDLNDELKIERLQAFWELPTMVWQFVRGGAGALPAGLALSGALLRNQRAAGTVGFLSGFRGLGGSGQRCLGTLLDDACAGDEVAVRRRLADAATITLGDSERISTSQLTALLHGARWDKMIRAGRTVVARVERDGHPTLLFGELAPRPTRISHLKVFADHG